MNIDDEMFGDISDPINFTAKKLMGIQYLFPYQRLVVSNILETAEAHGIDINWPEEIQLNSENLEIIDQREIDNQDKNDDDVSLQDNESEADEENLLREDRVSMGKQIVILPTGAGKSLCFQLPAMLLDGPTLVIYPILSLMADQERRLAERGFKPVILRGEQSESERDEIWRKLQTKESRFIIANPEVLLSPKVFSKLASIGIVHLVIDEAHCVSEWGESFRPTYLEIGKIIDEAKVPIITAFTATASAPVLQKIEHYIFRGEGAHKVLGNPNRINIFYYAKGAILRNLAVKDTILQNERPVIVFCSSRSGTERLAHYLRESLNEKEIRFYHAGLSRAEKTKVEEWFFKSPNGILTATCAYGMGVDKADIRTVIHRDCPPSVEAYLQESGRAGRDGHPSKAILLFGPDDETSMKRVMNDYDRERLFQLINYAGNIQQCRRTQLLSLLNFEGDTEITESGCCDVCEGTANNEAREEAGIAAFFKRNWNMHTVSEAAKILTQTKNPQWSEEDVKIVLNHLLKKGSLRKNKIIFWKDKIIPAKKNI
jgi:ATP-dependent DNA helicase RecQ